MKPKLTQAQSLLLQSLIPLVGGVIVTTATAGYQAFMSGHVDLQTAWNFLLATFLVSISQALRGYVPAHIPQELQALKDTQAQLLDEFNQLTMARPVVRATGPQPILLKQPTAPTAALPAFVPPARPATIQATAQPEVAQVPFPVMPQEPAPDQGG